MLKTLVTADPLNWEKQKKINNDKADCDHIVGWYIRDAKGPNRHMRRASMAYARKRLSASMRRPKNKKEG